METLSLSKADAGLQFFEDSSFEDIISWLELHCEGDSQTLPISPSH